MNLHTIIDLLIQLNVLKLSLIKNVYIVKAVFLQVYLYTYNSNEDYEGT